MNDGEGEEWKDILRRIRSGPSSLLVSGNEINMSDENWEQFGRGIAKKNHLATLDFYRGALNDHTMTFLFRGLTRSRCIKRVSLYNNGLSAVAVRSMLPFLKNANNLTELDLRDNDIQSEGFNFLLRALSDSPINKLICQSCGIESIEIDIEHKPKHLEKLFLSRNRINADGCRELAKLLQGGDAVLEFLSIPDNNIGDEGVEILSEALQSNTSLRELYLQENNEISDQGRMMLLKLVNDVSSIEATLQSNHTLRKIYLFGDKQSLQRINTATAINRLPEEAGREKVIKTQLHSERRAELAELQGVDHSVYSEINPLHLPEVLALVGDYHGQEELYVALKSSIAGVISVVNRKECLKQHIAEKRAKIVAFQTEIEAAEAEVEAIEAAEVHEMVL